MVAETYDSRKDYFEAHHEHASEDIDIRELYLMFWRRRYAILSVLLAGLSLAVLVISSITPKYSAQALMLFEPNSKKVSPQEFLLPFNVKTVDFAFILTELEILKSKKFAIQVVKKLDLVNDSEFVSPHMDSDDNGRKTDVQPRFKNLEVGAETVGTEVPDAIDEPTAIAAKRLLTNLKVASVPGSTLVSVNYMSKDAYKSALIANTVVDTYREQKLAEKFAVRQNLMKWLDGRLKEGRAKVFDIETQIEEFKLKNNLQKGRNGWIAVERLETLNQKLLEAQGKYQEIKTQLEQFDKQSGLDINIASYSSTVNIGSVKDVQTEIRRVESELTQMTNRYGPKHPEIIGRQAKLSELKKSMLVELGKTKTAIKNELEVAQTHIDEINKQITEASTEFKDNSGALIQLAELERESESSKRVLKTLLETYNKSVGETDSLASLGVDILSYANVPYEIAYPNKSLMFSLAAFVSLSLGLIVAVLLEKLDGVFRRKEQLEKVFGMPCHIGIPALKRVKNSADYVISKPASHVAEAVRTLRMILKDDAAGDAKSQLVVLTSSTIGEGKSPLAIWLGRLSAKAGEKVVVVDTNLRDPNIHKELGIGNSPSLVDYLSGKSKLEDILMKDSSSSMHIIAAQSVPNSAFDLVSSDKMNTMIETLKKSYDLIIFNAPPCRDIPDAKVLAHKADHVIYTVAANRTPRDFVTDGVKYFLERGGKGFGFVMTNMR